MMALQPIARKNLFPSLHNHAFLSSHHHYYYPYIITARFPLPLFLLPRKQLNCQNRFHKTNINITTQRTNPSLSVRQRCCCTREQTLHLYCNEYQTQNLEPSISSSTITHSYNQLLINQTAILP